VRGEAMHAVVQYALWVRRHLDRAAGTGKSTPSHFGELPEVRVVLEEHLDPNRDPSLAVRSVYGQYFPWLVLLDPAWAQENVEKIFPSDSESWDYFWAAWIAYVSSCEPYNNILEVIKDKYLLASMHVATTKAHPMSEGFPGRLAQ